MRGKPIVMDDFRGGVNTDAGPYNVKSNECRDARNVQATSRGAIRKRGGSVLWVNTPNPLTSLFASSNPRFILGSTGAAIYSMAPGGGVTSIDTGHAANSLWEWAQAPPIAGEGPFYGMNNVVARQWTGAGAAAAWTATTGTLPIGKYIKYHGNRMWIANLVGDPSAVQFSNIGDPRDWPPSNIVRFDPNDGEEITGIGTAGPYILVFKPSKIWLITDLDTGGNRMISRNVGCIAPRSIVETPDGTFFLTGAQGVMVANQNNTQLLSDNQRLSDAILPTILGLSTTKIGLSAAVYHDQHYLLSVPQTVAGNSLMLDYDMQNRSWWLHDLGMADMVTWERTTGGGRELLAARTGASALYELFSDDTNSDPWGLITAYWLSPFLTFGKPMVRKRCREIHFDGEGRIQTSIAKDFSPTPTLADDSLVTGVGPQLVGEASVYTPGVARAWSIMFGNATTDPFVIDSFSLMMQERTD